MKIRPIRNQQDHEAALRLIESLWGSKDGSPEFDDSRCFGCSSRSVLSPNETLFVSPRLWKRYTEIFFLDVNNPLCIIDVG